ncbi:hypothetical protein [Trichlorobacter lovleyi]|uniref:hypothetical protein n=1 Tax=Trichlorobacter lovleyi TaxID=313985 RepID=UPI003D0E2CDE
MIRRVVEAPNVPAGVPEAPVDGKSYARKDGGWSEVTGSAGSLLVREITTTGYNSAVTFDLLDLLTDKNYELEIYFAANADTSLSLRVNGVSTSDYQCVYQQMGSTPVAGFLSGHYVGDVQDSYRMEASLKVSLNAVKSACVSLLNYDVAGFDAKTLLPPIGNITELSLVSSVANGIGAGVFRLYKKAS